MSNSTSSSLLPQIAFIVGMGRSGTTLLTNMLNSNPEIVACPENEFVIHAYRTFYQKDFNDIKVIDAFIDMFNQNFNRVISIWKPGNELRNDILQLKDKSFENVCKLTYLNYPFSQKDKKNVRFVIDKNPFYSLHIDTLKIIFPDAKFIVIVRDYRDNIVSRKKYSDQNIPLHKLAADWNFYYEQISLSLSNSNTPYHLIKYEDLASNPTDSLQLLCSYLGVTYSDEMLNFQELSKEMKKQAVHNISREKNEKIQRMHGNLEKKVNTERVNAFVNELKEDEISILDFACEKLALTFGYKKHSPSTPVPIVAKLLYRFSYLKTTIYRILLHYRYQAPTSKRKV